LPVYYILRLLLKSY